MSRIRKVRKSSQLGVYLWEDLTPSSQYPQTYAGFPPDMDDWNCDQFKMYYQNNKAIIGKVAALQLIQNEAAKLSFTSTISNWCKYDCDFVNYFKNEGLTTGNIFSTLYCATSNVVDAVGSVTGAVSNTADFFSGLTKNKLLMAGLLAGGAYYFYNRYEETRKRS